MQKSYISSREKRRIFARKVEAEMLMKEEERRGEMMKDDVLRK
jgi:hypothetical protein